MQLIFRFRISVINANGNKLKIRDQELSVDKSKYFILNKIISHDDLYQHFSDGALVLFCEIGAIENWDKTELSTTKKEEYLRLLSKLTPRKNEVTETLTNAKAKKIQFEYIWEIENCGKTSDTEPSSVFTSHPTSSYIESPPFSPPNHSTTNQHRFYLRMYPNGENEESKDYVSMYLNVETFEKRQVTCVYKISLIDCFGFKLNTEEYKRRYNYNDVWGWPKYISHSDFFNQTNELITDNKLRVHCEVEFVDEEEIEENQIAVKETNDDTKPTNISITESHSALTPTESITQVTLHTHHWTIDNFGLYFKSIQDESSYLESPQFSPASDNQLQFVLRLCPKRIIDHLSIYFNLLCNRKQSPPGQVHISVLDENDRKCYTQIRRVQDGNVWQGFKEINWKDIQLEPNFINQIKLLFEYQLCVHYSSPTEMSHLDQFSLDHFTSPWQVKRQCDVPTHSRALTSIPVESCHFEWSIHEYSNQQKSMQSQPYHLGQLEFYLKMYSQQENRILIYLCLKKSVEKEIKMCMEISFLDKDGHKISTKDVIKKLTNVELEYECAEFEINEDVIQEDGLLKLLCEFNLVEEPTCSSIFVAPIPKVLPNLNKLLTNRQPSDVVLRFTDGKQLHAHRSILSFQSSVFEKMFEHDTIEAQHGQVDIPDVDMEVCELMLRYIYTGLVQLDQTWTLDLMIAADKYQLNELKDQCEEWLCKNISLDNLSDYLIVIYTIDAPVLKAKAFEYFHSNFEAIFKTNIFQHLRESAVNLLVELYPKLEHDLQQSSRQCDAVLHFVDGKQLRAHREILSNRSSVFSSILQHTKIDAEHNYNVEMIEFDIEVIEHMLLYMYTSRVVLDHKMAKKLFEAAVKYEMNELKDKCDEWLSLNLSLESGTDYLTWSHQNGALKLKTKSIEYFHKQASEMSKANMLIEFNKKQPELFTEIYLHLVNHNSQGAHVPAEVLEDNEKEPDMR